MNKKEKEELLLRKGELKKELSEVTDAQQQKISRAKAKYKEQIDALVAAWTKVRSMEEISQQLRDAEVPCTMVPTLDQVCNDPHLLSREMIIDVEQLVSGKVKAPGSVFKLSKTPGDVKLPAPFLGEHNYEIYSGMLGYSEMELRKLADEGVI